MASRCSSQFALSSELRFQQRRRSSKQACSEQKRYDNCCFSRIMIPRSVSRALRQIELLFCCENNQSIDKEQKNNYQNSKTLLNLLK